MKKIAGIGLSDVQAEYGGPGLHLWELIMGEQIHIGGFTSSMGLAEKAGISAGASGVDLCCCTGGGMRFLVRFRNVAKMTGVDATPQAIEVGKKRCKEQGLADRIGFVQADACDNKLPTGKADFVWGEDAWCYVVDKAKLIAEAARIARPGGTIAFTDWVEGPKEMAATEAERYLKFMKFPNVLGIQEYRDLLSRNGCEVLAAEDTGRFAPYVDLYLQMVSKQLTYDALRIIGFNMEMLQAVAGDMTFMQGLAHAGKISQGLLVARKR